MNNAYSVTAPPNKNRYQLVRLSLGNARSRAPIISGTRKLPSVVGMEGIRKNQTITTPCIVNSLLYISELRKADVGDRRFKRMSVAASPPTKNMSVMLIRYRMPMRL